MATAFRFDLTGRPVLSLVGPPLSGLSKPPVSPDSVFRLGPSRNPLHDTAYVAFGLVVDETPLDVFTVDHLVQVRVARAETFDPAWAPALDGPGFRDAADPVGGLIVAGSPHTVSFVGTTGFDPETKTEIVGLTAPAALVARGTPIRPVDGATAADGLFGIGLDAGNGVKRELDLHKRTAIVRLKQQEFVELARDLTADRRLGQLVIAAYALDPDTGLVSAGSVLSVQPA